MKWTTRLFKQAQPYLKYTVSRTVKFQDPWMALANYTGILIVVIYTIVDILIQQGFKTEYVPTNTVVAYMESTSDFTHGNVNYKSNFTAAQIDFHSNYTSTPKTESYRYCNNQTTWYKYSDDWNYSNINCQYPIIDQISRKVDDSIFVTTLKQTAFGVNFVMGAGEECSQSAFQARNMICPAGSEVMELLGSCRCTGKGNYAFMVGAENLTLSIDHMYDTPILSGKKPKTYIRRESSDANNNTRPWKGQDEVIFEEGEQVSMPVWKWLEVAGLDLDTPNTFVSLGMEMQDDPNVPGKPSQIPSHRLTGVVLSLSFNYYNYNARPTKKFSKKPVCILTVRAESVWASQGHMTDQVDLKVDTEGNVQMAMMKSYDYGVKFKFTATGTVGEFKLSSLITSLATASVLIGQVSVVITTLTFMRGDVKAKTYSEMANTPFKMTREYARFAVHSIMAHATFNLIDTDGCGYITRSELHESLIKVFTGPGVETKNKQKLEEEDLKVLTEFITKEADIAQEGMELQEVGDGRVSLAEWLEIMTADTTHYDSLLHILHNMDPAEKRRLLARFSGSLADKEKQGQV